jgi:hypothetical protein
LIRQKVVTFSACNNEGLRSTLLPRLAAILAAVFFLGSAVQAQNDERPLPDIATLLRDIAKNQAAIEEIRKLYTCHLSEQEDKTDSDGRVTSRSEKDYDVFYIGDEEVRRLIAKDGKPLDAIQRKREEERFNKRFDELKKKQAELAADPKKQAKQQEQDEAQISDFLRAEAFTNPRRTTFHGEDVIAFDFAGNPNYKAKKTIDRIVQKLSGVMWVDDQAREIARLEARFAESAHVGAGLVGSIDKGSNFVFEQQKLNEEVWLPSYAEVHVAGRIFVVKLKQSFVDRYSDYKKFRVGATVSPAPAN